MQIPFEAVTWKQGTSVVITIPSDFVKNGQVRLGQKLKFSVEVDGHSEVEQ